MWNDSMALQVFLKVRWHLQEASDLHLLIQKPWHCLKRGQLDPNRSSPESFRSNKDHFYPLEKRHENQSDCPLKSATPLHQQKEICQSLPCQKREPFDPIDFLKELFLNTFC